MKQTTGTAPSALRCDEAGFEPVEERRRRTIRATIEALFEGEPGAFLGRVRQGRGAGARKGCRHGRA